MIDVPARVKDALRSGEYKKNYRIYGNYSTDTYQRFNDITVTKETSTRYAGTYDFSGFSDGEKVKFRAPNESAFSFSSIAIYITGFNPREVTATVSDEGTTAVITYTSNLDNATFRFNGVSGGGAETVNFEVWRQKQSFSLDNNNLVSESITFDERMCSDSELKFGLCEGTSVEFQYFNAPNLKGQHITIEIDVQYKNEQGALAWQTIPMGQFDVTECSRQASTGIIKATAYNKLNSDYLNASAKDRIIELIEEGKGGPDGKIMIGVILDELMGGYQGSKKVDITPEAISSGTQDPLIYMYRMTNNSGQWSDYWLFAYVRPTLLVIPNVDDEEAYEFEVKSSQLCAYLENYSLNNPVVGRNMSPLDFKVNWPGHIPPVINNAVTVREGLGGDTASYYTNPNTNPKMMEYILRYEEAAGSSEERIAFDRKLYKSGYYDTPIDDTGWFTNLKIEEYMVSTWSGVPCGGLMFYIPTAWKTVYFSGGIYPAEGYDPFTQAEKDAADDTAVSLVLSYAKAAKMPVDSIERTELTLDEVKALSSITLRDLQSAVFELDCKYGKFDRVLDMFEGVELNNGGLFPADTLYPANDLYPYGRGETGFPAMYSKLWADEGNVRSFRKLIITYKTTETISGQEQQVDATLELTINADGTDDYNMDDNWLLRNLTWTTAQVRIYANEMVTKMQSIKWFPFEMWCAGLPYVEAGDGIDIQMSEGSYPSYVLRRVLKGIQNLQDEMINGTLDIF